MVMEPATKSHFSPPPARKNSRLELDERPPIRATCTQVATAISDGEAEEHGPLKPILAHDVRSRDRILLSGRR